MGSVIVPYSLSWPKTVGYFLGFVLDCDTGLYESVRNIAILRTEQIYVSKIMMEGRK